MKTEEFEKVLNILNDKIKTNTLFNSIMNKSVFAFGILYLIKDYYSSTIGQPSGPNSVSEVSSSNRISKKLSKSLLLLKSKVKFTQKGALLLEDKSSGIGMACECRKASQMMSNDDK